MTEAQDGCSHSARQDGLGIFRPRERRLVHLLHRGLQEHDGDVRVFPGSINVARSHKDKGTRKTR